MMRLVPTNAGHVVAAFDHLSIVVPTRNAAAGLLDFHERLSCAVAQLPLLVEIIYVDDGSRDASPRVLRQLRVQDTRVAVLELSRCFGEEAAMMAGLDHAHGDAAVVVPFSLQEPAGPLAKMVTAWRSGFDIVLASCADDFRLLSRRAVEVLQQLPECNRRMKDLLKWTGLAMTVIECGKGLPQSNDPARNYSERLACLVHRLTAFSVMPMRIMTAVLLVIALLGLLSSLALAVVALRSGVAGAGLGLATVVLLIGSIQILIAGMHSEYLRQLSVESKRRPLYLLKNVQPAAALSRTSRITAVGAE
jgi:hypothetical protein